MPIGRGKYDALCTKVREETEAKAAIVIVIGGIHGSGFSVQCEGADMRSILPGILETIAKEMRKSL